jgi:CubicO group peptidase (beta-lactamase class C family)
MRNGLLFLFLVPFSLAGFSQPNNKKTLVNEEGILVSSMKNESMDAVMIQNLDYAIRKGVYANIHSLLIARNGKLVYEKYFDGYELIESDPPLKHFTKDNLHDLRSVTKSITSACIGIAIAQGKIKTVDQKVFEFFPEYSKQDTGLKSALTIKHLLTMAAGLLWNEEIPYTSNENTEVQMDISGDPLTFILERPMQDTAGKVWNYCGGATQLLGCIIEKATGQKLEEFTAKYLFEPLGIKKFYWKKFGGTDLAGAAWGLRLRPRDMLKFGLLYFNNGKWNDKQMIPAAWVAESLSTQVPRDSAGGGYGYQFWTWSGELFDRPVQIALAVGNGDQNIIIDKKNGLLLVATAGNYDKSVTKDVNSMLIDYVYPALLKK